MPNTQAISISNSTPSLIPLGPVMLDVAELQLDDSDRRRLRHPNVGGVILFARNFEDRQQVAKLITEIKGLRTPALLVAVDQEGGRVQRFKKGFSLLPPTADFGALWDQDKHTAPMRAYESAKLMASELISVGVDFSFAPVFDITSKDSEVIGDRCFHSNPLAATELLGAYIDGMHSEGMVAIAKHFPGHGGVSGDSHNCLPSDSRTLAQIEQCDLIPYRELVDEIQGVMSAHVLFDACDAEIPTYSKFWLQDVLREQLGFDGVIFSDDLTMQGAIDAQDDVSVVLSAQRAIYAGCDMVLVCNRPDLADELLDGLEFEPNQTLSGKLTSLSAR
ncbi:MAG: beta-N-acetylhexosaminidase [Arenicella sp.]|jgi:beta-N-acetylhexosaminidase